MKFLFPFFFLLSQISYSEALDDFKKFQDDEWTYLMQEYPEWATWKGITEHNDKWTDYSIEAYSKRRIHAQEAVSRLARISREQLPDTEKVNYDVIKYKLDLELEGYHFPSEFFPLTQLRGLQFTVPRTLRAMPLKNKVDADNYLSRLKAIPRLINQTIVLLEAGIKANVVLPTITSRDIGKQIEALTESSWEENPITKPLKEIEETQSFRKTTIDQGKAILTKSVIPAMKKFHSFFTEIYYPKTRKTIALTKLPNGTAWYQYLAKYHTTTTMSTDEVNKTGSAHIRSLWKEMKSLAIAEEGFKGNEEDYKLDDFVLKARTDKKYFYDNAEDLVRGYRDIAKQADAALPKLFGKLPRLPYGVKEIPDYQAASAPTAYYYSGSLKAGRAGMFMANTYKVETRPKWEMVALTLHEAVPGHHLQIALAEESELHDYRRNISFTAFVEGWGLYAESLGREVDLYPTPMDKFGQLAYDMWRAVRLVVDTSIHNGGMTRMEAIRFMQKYTGKSEHDATMEIDRYIVMPGQALAYKVGQLTIRRLRDKAESELGEKFSVRDFHDKLLENGSLPMEILESQMNIWIEDQKSRSPS